MRLQGLAAEIIKQGHRLQLRQRDQPGAHTVINVVRVVGNLVSQIAQLRLQAGLGAIQKTPPDAVRLQRLQLFGIGAGAMFENAFARLKRQVQAVKGRVPLFKRIHHAQALQVVLKAAMFGHTFVKRILARVPKGRVPQVMGQRNGLNQIFVQPQRARHGATQLRHLQRVCEPRAKQVAFMVQKNLRFVHQPPKRGGVDDAVAVALKVGARGRGLFGIAAATRMRGVTGVAGQRHFLRVNQTQHASITSRTSASGALRTLAWPGASITTKRISPASAFLSTRINSR